MAQQLCMSLRGNAQNLLSDLNAKQVDDYYNNGIKFALEQRFHPLVKNQHLDPTSEIVGGTKTSPSLI